MTKIRRAAKEHQCTERSYHTIAKGDRYLHAEEPPWQEMNQSGKWWVIRACLRCANEFGLHNSDTLKQLEAGIAVGAAGGGA
jgi:hypothetical protein